MGAYNLPAKIGGAGRAGDLLHGMGSGCHQMDAWTREFCIVSAIEKVNIPSKRKLGRAYISVNSNALPENPLNPRESVGICEGIKQ